jgi:hypothetical protein
MAAKDEHLSDDEFDEEEDPGLTSPDVVTKYKTAAEIANSILLIF